MKAVVIPEVNGTWELTDLPTPRPGPAEVLVRVRACGICSNDVLAARGVLPFPSTDPAVPGHEPAGEIVEIGSAVTTRKVGDHVGTTWIRGTCGNCAYCRLDRPLSGNAAFGCTSPTSTGFTVQGGHAEYMTVAADETVLLPEGLPPELAVPVLCAGYTSLSALHAAEPEPRERVAVLGIGALGHLALQFAHAYGFETVAITSSAEKRELAGELGADLVVADGEQLREAGGADVVLVTGSSYAAATATLQGLRINGRMVLAGFDTTEPFVIPPTHPFFGLGQRIIGATHDGRRHLREALDLVASGKVTPMIETFPKERIAEAAEKAAKNEVRFRAVVTY